MSDYLPINAVTGEVNRYFKSMAFGVSISRWFPELRETQTVVTRSGVFAAR